MVDLKVRQETARRSGNDRRGIGNPATFIIQGRERRKAQRRDVLLRADRRARR